MAPRPRERHTGRRVLVALVLVLVGAVAAGAAVAAEEDGASVDAVGAAPTVTPVLSARRVPALLAAPVADRRLAAALDGIASRQEGLSCLTVASSGRVVYEREATTVLVPASLDKLLTATAALEVLGADHRYRTAVVAAAAPDADGVVAGDVFLVGDGDPVLSTADYAARFRNQPQITTPLEGLADALVGAGVRRVAGRLVGDEARYDTDRYPDVWPERYVSQDQSGPLTALSVNDGWATYPPNPDAGTPDEAPAPDPAAVAAERLRALLVARGVAVDGGAAAGPAPPGAVELAAVDSPPLTDVVTQLLRESDNQTGELLLKELAVARGRPGTTVDGAAVVTEVLAGLGLPVGTVVDGSGLATGNRVTCALLQAVLDRAGAGSPIRTGLATAGVDGTLARRFVGTPVAGRLRAKTGTLNAVTALAGYLETTPGASTSFAFVVNIVGPDDVDDVTSPRIDQPDLAIQDELVAAIDRYPEGPALELLAPAPVVALEPSDGG